MLEGIKDFFVQHYKLMMVVLLLFVFALLAVGAIYLQNKVSLIEANEQIQRLNEEKQDIVRNLAVVEVEADTLRSSQLELRQTIEQQQQQIAEQDKALDFYRQLMTAGGDKKGLELNDYLLKKAGGKGVYYFRFTFVQFAKKHYALKAALSITVEGESLSDKVSYNFRELVTSIDDQFGNLRFKYFQVVEGQLQLPEGFVPQQIIIDAQIKTKKPKAWQRKLDWIVEES